MKKKVSFLGIIILLSFMLTISVSASKASAKKILKKNTSQKICKFYYTNLDGRKGKEAVVITAAKTDEMGYQGGTVWYIKGKKCQRVYTSDVYIYKFDNHLYKVKGGRMLTFETGAGGSGSLGHAVVFKRNGASLVENVSSTIKKTGRNKFTMVDSVFDITYDAGKYSGHSYKKYYYFWTGRKFVEYGGIEITERQFKKLKNGKKVLKELKKHGKISNIIYRKNGIINVNYRRYSSWNSWNNYNITLKVKSKKAHYFKVNDYGKTKIERAKDEGIYLTHISSSVTYPKGFVK